jgi:hypothetical protein
MAPHSSTILTGRNLPTIRQSRKIYPSTINKKTVGDFTRVVEQTGSWRPLRQGRRLIRQPTRRLKSWPRNITRHHCPAATSPVR